LVTLEALSLTNHPEDMIRWEEGVADGPFLVVSPSVTTSYRVWLFPENGDPPWEDWTTVWVHPEDPDLDQSGSLDEGDWRVFFSHWAQEPTPALDPDDDGRVTLLDWFFFCNFDRFPVNTPPVLTTENLQVLAGETVVAPYELLDQEQADPVLLILTPPVKGSLYLVNDTLYYACPPDQSGWDQFSLSATDGTFTLPAVHVTVNISPLDSWENLYQDIFFVHCKACHIDAQSGGLSLASYGLAQAAGAFIPGQPQLSPLYLRTANGSMPIGRPPLTPEEVDRIRQWILRGAPP
jgi:hypothetical protein